MTDALTLVPFAEPRGITRRTCTKCGEAKPLGEFGPSASGRLGRRADCKLCVSQHNAARYADNPELFRERAARYQAAHPEKRRARRAANPEAKRAEDRRYRAEKPEMHRARNARRRARRAAATVEDFSHAELMAHWDNISAYACVACSAPFEHIDHVQPLALGGEHSVYNLLPLCGTCNTRKNAKNPYRWIAETFPNTHIGQNLASGATA